MSTMQRADSDIQQDLDETLRGAGLPLNVSVEEGKVTLEGAVYSEEEREAAIDLAQVIAGVSDIEDAIQIMEIEGEQPTVLFGSLTQPTEWDPATDETDDDWTTDERTAIEDGETYVAPSDPPVDISDRRDGIEVASGFQTSATDDDEEMYRDQDDIDPGEPRDVHDSEIVDNVVRELNEDATTTHLNIHVASVRGTVFLTGYVTDPNDGDLAASVAERVPGVRYVVDRLVVGERPALVARSRAQRGRRRPGGQVAMPGPAWRSTVARNERWLANELEKIQQQIDERKEELASFGRDQSDEGSVSNHQGDIASDVAASETLNTEIVNLEEEVDTIRELQLRMENGKYGICVDCGRYIDPARLRAFPLALRCIDDQRRLEDEDSSAIPAGRQIG